MINYNYESATEAPYDITEKTESEMENLDTQVEETRIDETTTDDNAETETTDEADVDTPVDDTDTMTDDGGENFDENIEEDPEELEKEYNKKVRIHNNMILFLDLVKNNHDSFNNKYNKCIESSRYKDFHVINKTFNDLIDSIQNALATKFTNSDYTELVKYYVSYNRIYDIIVRMVEHFVIDNKDESKS